MAIRFCVQEHDGNGEAVHVRPVCNRRGVAGDLRPYLWFRLSEAAAACSLINASARSKA